jgi:hypothetical protein
MAWAKQIAALLESVQQGIAAGVHDDDRVSARLNGSTWEPTLGQLAKLLGRYSQQGADTNLAVLATAMGAFADLALCRAAVPAAPADSARSLIVDLGHGIAKVI